MANDSSTSTTGEMLAYLQQLRARVASLEQPMDAGNAISDSDDEDEEVMKHYQGCDCMRSSLAGGLLVDVPSLGSAAPALSAHVTP